MQYQLVYNLPFIKLQVLHNHSSVELDNVLLDTGSVTSIFSADSLEIIGIAPSSSDTLKRIAGVGGTELVYEKCLDLIISSPSATWGCCLDRVAVCTGCGASKPVFPSGTWEQGQRRIARYQVLLGSVCFARY